jgi:hypothetical protein
MYVQPLDGSLTPNSLVSPAANFESGGALYPGGGTLAAGDDISRFVPPPGNDGAASLPYGASGSLQGIFGPLMGLLQQLMQMLQSITGNGCENPYGSPGCPPYTGGNCPPSGGNCPPYGNERFFQNASGSSEGDPHLSFNGAKWNNMTSQPDLLNSNSFAGGFRVSTQVTPPNAKGVTWNQAATVTLDNGATSVSMNDNGQASVTNDGRSVSIARGQTLQLGNGESVTYQQNGALRVTAQNQYGGRIETTLTPDGKGVNVDVTAHDVDLGGTLVNGYEDRHHGGLTGPIPGPVPVSGPPIPMPISGPIPGPIPEPAPYTGLPEPFGPWPQPQY